MTYDTESMRWYVPDKADIQSCCLLASLAQPASLTPPHIYARQSLRTTPSERDVRYLIEFADAKHQTMAQLTLSLSKKWKPQGDLSICKPSCAKQTLYLTPFWYQTIVSNPTKINRRKLLGLQWFFRVQITYMRSGFRMSFP